MRWPPDLDAPPPPGPTHLLERPQIRIESQPGVLNSGLMIDVVYKFKRYENPSLSYPGINRHEGEDIGLFDTVLTGEGEEYRATFVNSPREK